MERKMATTEESSNDENGEIAPFWQLAKDGIKLLLNNRQREAETLFKSYPHSLQMNAGYAYAVFTDALMTFEDDKLQQAQQTLKELEKKCSSYSGGWMRSMRSKMFGCDTNSYAEQLESQIILADSHIFVATVTFLQHDISGYIKGAWILRKAYKHYQQVYNEILALYKEIASEHDIPGRVNIQTLNEPLLDIRMCDPLEPPESFIVDSSDEAKIADYCRNIIVESLGFESLGEPIEDETPTKNEELTNPNEQVTILNEQVTIVNELVTIPIENMTIPIEDVTNPIIPKEELIIPKEELIIPTHEDLYENACPVVCVLEKVPIPSNSKNGYISHNRISIPSASKHSASCHAALSSYASQANGYVSSRKGSKRRRSKSFLKKSASLHSALSEQSRSFGGSLSFLTSTFNIFSSKNVDRDIDKATISRLLCAVSFGYGLLQLGISLLPPSVLRVTSFLGFGGNRRNGLDNLMYARLGDDMRAPFASLAILWYHTIVRPFFALDGSNIQAGVEAAAQLIEETKQEFEQSSLFLFFKGRVERLNSDIPAAIEAFQASIENASQREIKTLSMHEVGWCYLINLDYAQSESTFQSLKQSSRWSRSFYSYLSIVSAGSKHTFQEAERACDVRNMFQPVSKGTQLDEFLNRRYKICPTEERILKETSCLYWKLLVYEMLYLWNALPCCTVEHLKKIVEDCASAVELKSEPMVGLSKLIEGSGQCILRNYVEGISCFRSCLETRKSLSALSDGAHISAFAQYELGLLLIRNEQTKPEGKKLLQSIPLTYKDYDFEQRLSVRLHTILKNL